METPINPSSQRSNIIKQVATIIVLVLIILLVAWFMKNRDQKITPSATEPIQNSDTETQTTDNTPSSDEQTAPVIRRYTNGTYSATGNYVSPAGTEEIDLTITVKDDVVVSAQFTGKATHQTSQFMQGKFKDGFSELVVGKTVGSISLTVVNGSSLTPKGFMEALNKIKDEANT